MAHIIVRSTEDNRVFKIVSRVYEDLRTLESECGGMISKLPEGYHVLQCTQFQLMSGKPFGATAWYDISNGKVVEGNLSHDIELVQPSP